MPELAYRRQFAAAIERGPDRRGIVSLAPLLHRAPRFPTWAGRQRQRSSANAFHTASSHGGHSVTGLVYPVASLIR